MAASYKKLFKLMIDREIKSKDLAAQAGISPTTLAKMKKDGATVSSGTVLFTAPKHFNFVDPELEVYLDGDEIVVKASAYARSVEIYSPDSDFVLSDNFFDMNAGEKRVKVLEGTVGELRARSVFDIR